MYNWANHQRLQKRRNKLAAGRAVLLCSLPGWDWGGKSDAGAARQRPGKRSRKDDDGGADGSGADLPVLDLPVLCPKGFECQIDKRHSNHDKSRRQSTSLRVPNHDICGVCRAQSTYAHSTAPDYVYHLCKSCYRFKAKGMPDDDIAAGAVRISLWSRVYQRKARTNASWSLRSALLMLQVHPGPLYRSGKSN